MKIAHVLGTFDRTGVTTVVIQLSKTMADFGHEVDIIVWNDKNIPRLPDNVNIHIVKIFGLSRRPLSGKYFRKIHKYIFSDIIYNYLYSPIFSQAFENNLSNNQYQQIFFHGTRYYPFHKVSLRHVVVAHSIKSLCLLNSANKIKNIITKYCAKNIYHNKTIFTVSNGVKEDLINNFSANKSKIYCVYNPFDIKDIQNKSYEFCPRINPENNYILTIGRADKQKRFDILLQAYANSKIKQDLVIIGSNKKHFKGLIKLANSLHISNKVHFIDHTTNPFPYIRQAKLLVVTSEYEGFGNTIVESLICGVPVVSTDCMSGPREILTGELQKYLAETNNLDDITNKIKQCLKDRPNINPNILNKFKDKYVVYNYLKHASIN